MVRDYPQISFVYDPVTGRRISVSPRALGKDGIVEIEAWKLPRMIKLGKKLGRRIDENGKPIEYKFLPAKGVSPKGAKGPEVVISYWLMGRKEDGTMCPFLSTSAENIRTEDGTLKCLIYEDRPLPCRAYPVHAIYTWQTNGSKMASLDQRCDWVVEQATSGLRRASQPFPPDLIKGLDYGSFARLQSWIGDRFNRKETTLWRHATEVFGKGEKPPDAIEGWVNVGWD